jgi:hypothetical protein
VRQVDPSAIAQPAIAPDIEGLEIGLAHDREPALICKAGILLPVQRTFGTVIDVHAIHIKIHHPMRAPSPSTF